MRRFAFLTVLFAVPVLFAGPAEGVFARFGDAIGLDGADAGGIRARPVLPGVLDGAWEVEVPAAPDRAWTLVSPGGARLGPFVHSRFTVVGPSVWSDETPACYRLVASGPDGERTALVRFCTRETRDGRFFLNGRPVDLRVGDAGDAGGARGRDADEVFRALREARCNAVVSDVASALPGFRRRCFEAGVFLVERASAGGSAVDLFAAGSPAWRERVHAHRPFSVSCREPYGRWVVSNRQAFVDARATSLSWRLFEDGRETDDGRLDLFALAPRRSASFDLPDAVVRALGRGRTVSVRFSFETDGRPVAEDQIDYPVGRSLDVSAACAGDVPSFDAAGGCRTFETPRARWRFDPSTGLPCAFARRRFLFPDRELLAGAVRLCVETPAGRETLVPRAHHVAPVGVRAGGAAFSALVDGCRETSTGLVCRARFALGWGVFPDGTLLLEARRLDGPSSGRAGVSLPVAASSARVSWFGRGPWPHVPGACSAAFRGRWTDAAFAGGREDVFAARFGGLSVRTAGAPFALVRDGDVFSLLADGTLRLAVSPGDAPLAPCAFPAGWPVSDFDSERE